MKQIIAVAAAWLILSVFSVFTAVANEYQGTVRAGYIYTDIEGNQGVHQPTFNLYDGVAFSLEQFRYQWANGRKLTASLYNPFLDNRRLKLGFSEPGRGGLNFNHSAYRRTYDFKGDNSTRRQTSSGSIWLRPMKQVKLFGGFEVIDKNGKTVDFIEPELGNPLNTTDYTRRDIHGGMEVKYRGSYGRVEYRLADFNDDYNTVNDRRSKRLRATFYSPIPNYEQFALSGGFQHFTNHFLNRSDTLSANTVWGAVKYSHRLGYHVRYSFMFDRTHRTRDLTASDNIVHAVHFGKTWRGRGGITLGYGTRVNDDARVQRSSDEYSLAGWIRPIQALLIRGSMEVENDVIDSGRTLTGDRDRARNRLSAKYTIGTTSLRLAIEGRQRDNDDIGSSTEFLRFSSDLSVSHGKYGFLSASGSYGTGNYDNAAGQFEYTENTFSGAFMSREHRRMQVGFKGTYYRAERDVDLESFSVEFTGRYGIFDRTRLELVYSAHNFDNLDDPAVTYQQYYTANVVTVVVVYEL